MPSPKASGPEPEPEPRTESAPESPRAKKAGAGAPTQASDPAAVVVSFLRAWEDFDLDAALDLVHDDLVYMNVTLPTVRGRDRLEQAARPVLRPGRMGFRVHLHHIATDGDVVMTDRIDELSFRGFAMRFWVYGRFVVRDGRIAVWRDAFDWLDVTIGAWRGLLGLLSPAYNRRMPNHEASDDD